MPKTPRRATGEEPERKRRDAYTVAGGIVGLATAPDIPFDRIQGYAIQDGVLRINVTLNRFDPIERVAFAKAAATLICSVPALARLHDAVGQILKDLEREPRVETAAIRRDGGG